jgi:hypothetical protein
MAVEVGGGGAVGGSATHGLTNREKQYRESERTTHRKRQRVAWTPE